MATSGSFNTKEYNTGSGTRYLTFSWSRTNYSIENNTSTISYTLKGSGGYSGYVLTRNIKLIINGTTVYQSDTSPIKLFNGTVVKSGTITILHNSDGTKSFSVYAEAGIYYSAVNSTGSGTYTLDTIPRKSSVSATNGNIGSTTTITISRASAGFTHTLTWSCLGLSGTFYTKTTATTLYPTIPTSIYAKIPNTQSATVTVTCTTYSGSTSLGSATCTFKATADERSCKPSVTSTSLVDINPISKAITVDDKKFIKGISNAQISGVSASAKNSATIKSLIFRCDSKTAYVSDGKATINAVNSGTLTLTATDSRGYSNTATYTMTMYDYTKPTIMAKVYRPQQTGNEIKADFSGKYSTGISTNTIIIEYRYRESGREFTAWVTLAPTISNGSFSGKTSLGNEFDYRKEYDFEFKVTDMLNSVTYSTKVIRGIPVFDWGADDFNFNVPVKVKGQPVVDFITEQGTIGNWYYRKWNSGIAECWGEHSFTLNLQLANNIYYAGVWFDLPFTFAEKPIVTGSTHWYYANWAEVFSSESDFSKCGCLYYQTNTNGNGGTRKVSIHAIGKI